MSEIRNPELIAEFGEHTGDWPMIQALWGKLQQSRADSALLREALERTKDWLMADEAGGVMPDSDAYNEPFRKALQATRIALASMQEHR